MGMVPPPGSPKSFLLASIGSGSTQSGIFSCGHGIVGKSSWKLMVTGLTGSRWALQWPWSPDGWLPAAELGCVTTSPSLGIRNSGT